LTGWSADCRQSACLSTAPHAAADALVRISRMPWCLL
jgi:hypothetical protein